MLAVGSKQLQRVRGEVEMSSVHRQDLVCSSADYGKLGIVKTTEICTMWLPLNNLCSSM